MAPKKAQKMSLGSFLGNSDFGGTGSWADDMPDLPTAPAPKDESMTDYRGGDFLSSRPDRGPAQPREDVPLPTRPPFTSFVGNLAFDAQESDIKNLFQSEHEIVQVKIISDRDGKPKGFGYVEFATVEGLQSALSKHGMTFSNRQIRVNVAEPQKEREGGGFGRGDDEKFANPWRRDGPLPARDDFASGGPRRRYENIGGAGGEPREPTASEGNSDWRTNRPPPRVPSEADMPPRRRGSGMSTPRHEEPGAADTDEQWVRGARFHPSANADNHPPNKFGSVRGRPEGPSSATSPVTPPQADEGPWRRAKPAGSSSPTGSVPPTPQMGRRKLELLPRSTTGSAQPSPLSSPKEKGASQARASPFGAAKPVDVRAKEEAAAAKIAEREQHQPMSRTNSKQPRTRPPPTRSESASHSVEDTESAPRSPVSGTASPTAAAAAAPARDPSIRPSFSFANAAAAAAPPAVPETDVPAASQPADVEAVTEKLAEAAV